MPMSPVSADLPVCVASRSLNQHKPTFSQSVKGLQGIWMGDTAFLSRKGTGPHHTEATSSRKRTSLSAPALLGPLLFIHTYIHTYVHTSTYISIHPYMHAHTHIRRTCASVVRHRPAATVSFPFSRYAWPAATAAAASVRTLRPPRARGANGRETVCNGRCTLLRQI